MDVTVFLEHRFKLGRDGHLYTQAMFATSFWERYLGIFDRVHIASRAEPTDDIPEGWTRATSDRVLAAPLPCYIGPVEYLKSFALVRRAVRETIERRSKGAFILRVPGNVASEAHVQLEALGLPYAVEVVADPYDLFSPGTMSGPARVFFRNLYTRRMRKQCRSARSALYVTSEALQRRYPSRHGAPAMYAASDVELDPEHVKSTPVLPPADGTFEIVHVGTLDQLYKAPDVLLRAFSEVCARRPDTRLTIVGDGRLRPSIEQLAARLGCADRVRFTGQLEAGARVREVLDASHLFVMPSRQEGLPRAMVEAMARALPCVGTPVGGISELLDADALVPVNDHVALRDRIVDFMSDQELWLRSAERNRKLAAQYTNVMTSTTRRRFYEHVAQDRERHTLHHPPTLLRETP